MIEITIAIEGKTKLPISLIRPIRWSFSFCFFCLINDETSCDSNCNFPFGFTTHPPVVTVIASYSLRKFVMALSLLESVTPMVEGSMYFKVLFSNSRRTFASASKKSKSKLSIICYCHTYFTKENCKNFPLCHIGCQNLREAS